MMTEQIRPNLWRLEIPLEGSPLKTLNSYLITGERSLLIDTGFRWPSCRAAMHRALDDLGVDRDRMDIFCTHYHSDHVGLAPELIRPGCEIFMSAIDGPVVEEGTREESWVEWFQKYRDNGFSPEEMEALWGSNHSQDGAPLTWPQARCLADGDVLEYGGYRLRCMVTPGHTPGHTCLYEAERRWLFTGDHILFHISPNICRQDGYADSLGDYMDSLRRIRDLPAELLLPAHREDTGNLAERVDQLLAHHARRIENTMQVVAESPGMTAYQIAGQMRWKIRSKSWADFPLGQKLFAVGETLAHLDYLEVRGQVRRQEIEGIFFYFPAD